MRESLLSLTSLNHYPIDEQFGGLRGARADELLD
jgi:hypothetical protein